jgi:23S rRNA-/tRNA-specific pseudouridylate synthase
MEQTASQLEQQPPQQLQPHPHSSGRAPPTNPTQSILHVDTNYILIDKPADVRIDGDHEHTVVKLLAAALPQHAGDLRHCHQLDYATSGVMCYALSRRAASAAGWLFEQRKTKKVYLALLEGHMASSRAECSLPIADDPRHEFKMMVGTADVPGRAAQTTVVRLAVGSYRGRPVTKVELHPSSGRRHQLRVHCLALGHPIVGDATYNEDGESPRMMLHAWKLTLPLSLVPPKRRGVRSAQPTSKRQRQGPTGECGKPGTAVPNSAETGEPRGKAGCADATAGSTEIPVPMSLPAAAVSPIAVPGAIPGEDIEVTSVDPFVGLLD